ncbi:MAG: protein kinase [Chloroflexi bacterium]|nr:protein kinase [Chloroflexota bacterium]
MIRQRLGSGGFASVYRAYDPGLDREVALKVLHPHLYGDTNVRERFIREGRALARVRHPNIVVVHEAGEADGAAFLAMELIEGDGLDDILATNGPFQLNDVIRIANQVSDALAAVHARGLVHRDIKPANILIERGAARAMLLDLGVARDLANATMTGGWIVGTPGYMAPEQVQAGGEITPRTDVYQLGATIYCLLAGRPPFEGDTLQVLDAIKHEAPPNLARLRPDLPNTVIATLGEAMAKDPTRRMMDTRTFAARLRVPAPAQPMGFGPPSGGGPPWGPMPPQPGMMSPAGRWEPPAPGPAMQRPPAPPSHAGPIGPGAMGNTWVAPPPRQQVSGATASFGRRLSAALIDLLISAAIVIVMVIPAILIPMAVMPDATEDEQSDFGIWVWLAFMIVGGWLYFALLESSNARATLGKRAAGLVVVDSAGNRLSLGRASVRYAARYLSWCTLLIGFAIAAFSSSRRTLHDVVSGTRVVRR